MCDFLYNLFCKKTKKIHVYDVSTFLNFQQENTTKLIYCKSVLVTVVVRNIPSSFFLKIFFEKISQILPGWGLEEHCWDNVLVAVVLLNFRPPVQYHAVARSTMEWQRRVPPSSSSSSRAGCPRQPGSYFRNEDFCFRASPRSLSSSSLQYLSLSQNHILFCRGHLNHCHQPYHQDAHPAHQEFIARTEGGELPHVPPFPRKCPPPLQVDSMCAG